MTLFTEQVPNEYAGMRLDRVLAELFPSFSRSKLKTWIKAGRVAVDGKSLQPKDRLEGGESIELDAEAEPVLECAAEAIALAIVHEDEQLLIVNKPAGLVVHPAAGNWQGTLQNALLYHDPGLAALPRAGIVHRIDKETSGLLMVAKTLPAHFHLVEQLQARNIDREYIALCNGRMTAGGNIDLPIGRHPTDRKRFAVRESGKTAITHYRVMERFAQHTLIQVKLETGRTHQIRVHMAHIRYPLTGDPVYGGRFKLPPDCPQMLATTLREFKRQALHAVKLGLLHPGSGAYCSWEIAPPEDMLQLLEMLRENERAVH